MAVGGVFLAEARAKVHQRSEAVVELATVVNAIIPTVNFGAPLFTRSTPVFTRDFGVRGLGPRFRQGFVCTIDFSGQTSQCKPCESENNADR